MFAPVPSIPDDLRDEVLQTEAMAHFTVSYDGTVAVALTQPTNNPRLNQILLDTLKQWRFFPAVKGGVAIDSAFDVRIPITVQ
jgi:protein TonB